MASRTRFTRATAVLTLGMPRPERLASPAATRKATWRHSRTSSRPHATPSPSGRAARAVPYAFSLTRILNKLDPRAESFPGNEYRSIIAELDGDLMEAVRYRLQEIRLFEKLIEKGQLETARLDWSDYADRYDLL